MVCVCVAIKGTSSRGCGSGHCQLAPPAHSFLHGEWSPGPCPCASETGGAGAALQNACPRLAAEARFGSRAYCISYNFWQFLIGNHNGSHIYFFLQKRSVELIMIDSLPALQVQFFSCTGTLYCVLIARIPEKRGFGDCHFCVCVFITPVPMKMLFAWGDWCVCVSFN